MTFKKPFPRVQSSSETTGTSGGYAYIDTAYPRHAGDSAVLRLASALTTQPDQPLCLVFYVSLFGSGLGSLSLVQGTATLIMNLLDKKINVHASNSCNAMLDIFFGFRAGSEFSFQK